MVEPTSKRVCSEKDWEQRLLAANEAALKAREAARVAAEIARQAHAAAELAAHEAAEARISADLAAARFQAAKKHDLHPLAPVTSAPAEGTV